MRLEDIIEYTEEKTLDIYYVFFLFLTQREDKEYFVPVFIEDKIARVADSIYKLVNKAILREKTKVVTKVKIESIRSISKFTLQAIVNTNN